MPKNVIDSPPPSDAVNYLPSQLFSYFYEALECQKSAFVETVSAQLDDAVSDGAVRNWRTENAIPRSGEKRQAFCYAVSQFCSKSVAEEWLGAFRHVWFAYPHRKQLSATERKNIAAAANQFLSKHKAWIVDRFSRPMMQETFSLEDVYVPIHLSKASGDKSEGLSPDWLEAYAKHSKQSEDDPNWCFIKGGPGSGKSVLASKIATSLSQDTGTQIIFLRASQLSDETDVSNLIESETVSDRFAPEVYFNALIRSKQKSACLVFDGIDEIGERHIGDWDRVDSLIQSLNTLITACREQGVSVRVLAFGRHNETSSFEERFGTGSFLSLNMGSLAGSIPGEETSDPGDIGPDLREMWWNKYLVAKSLAPTADLPEFLATTYSPVANFGLEPLLSYLICHIAFPPDQPLSLDRPANEVVDEAIETDNRNKIYAQIIDQVRKSKLWRPDSLASTKLDERNFVDVLKYMALSTWQEGSIKRTSIQRIDALVTDNPRVSNAFKSLVKPTNGRAGADNLITVFYYRVEQVSKLSGHNEIEFTHRTFAEYLTASLLFDLFEGLIDASVNGAPDALPAQMCRWSELVAMGRQTPELAEFIQDEAELRLAREGFPEKWHLALDIANQFIHSADLSSIERTASADRITLRKRSAQTLLVHWSALNRANYQRTNERYRLADSTPHALIDYDLKLMQPVSAFEEDSEYAAPPQLQAPTFAGFCFMATEFSKMDLSGLVFNYGNLADTKWTDISAHFCYFFNVDSDRTILENYRSYHTQFLFSGWAEARLQDCKFRHNLFDQVDITSTDIVNTEFHICEFLNCNFGGNRLDGVQFNNCVLLNCMFGADSDKSTYKDVIFRRCTFTNMDKEFCNRTDLIFEDCVFLEDKSKPSGAKLSYDVTWAILKIQERSSRWKFITDMRDYFFNKN